ncbi:hypothetical protein BC827DRAFT_1125158 [Russula dissimulans]|nr:hypothetical protein BC827DRAFT_1125158 [Russula dissimulans]
MSTSDNVESIIANALASLDILSPKDIPNLDDFCPICLLTFRAVLESHKDDLPGKSLSGVARVGTCGHLFCVEDLSEWIKGRHGTCPTCRYEFLPELRPLDSDAESSDGGEYVPTEYDADSDFDTDYEEGFMDSDGIDLETMDVDPAHAHHPAAGGGDDDDDAMSHELEAQSVCGSETGWWDESVDGEQEWGLTDGDSMGTSEGELSFGDRGFIGTLHCHLLTVECCLSSFLSCAETNVQVRLDSEEEYAIYEDGREPKS